MRTPRRKERQLIELRARSSEELAAVEARLVALRPSSTRRWPTSGRSTRGRSTSRRSAAARTWTRPSAIATRRSQRLASRAERERQEDAGQPDRAAQAGARRQAGGAAPRPPAGAGDRRAARPHAARARREAAARRTRRRTRSCACRACRRRGSTSDDALDALVAEHAEKIKTPRERPRRALAALESRLCARARRRPTTSWRSSRWTCSAARGELSALREAKETGDAAARGRDGRPAGHAGRRHVRSCAISTGSTPPRATASPRSRASWRALRQDLGEAQQKLAAESARADKAHAKWEADRQSLERAKDALAVALAQIEEAEGRSSSEHQRLGAHATSLRACSRAPGRDPLDVEALVLAIAHDDARRRPARARRRARRRRRRGARTRRPRAPRARRRAARRRGRPACRARWSRRRVEPEGARAVDCREPQRAAGRERGRRPCAPWRAAPRAGAPSRRRGCCCRARRRRRARAARPARRAPRRARCPEPSFRFALGQCTMRVPSRAMSRASSIVELDAVGEDRARPRDAPAPQHRHVVVARALRARPRARRVLGGVRVDDLVARRRALDGAAHQRLAARQDEPRRPRVADAPAARPAPRRGEPLALVQAGPRRLAKPRRHAVAPSIIALPETRPDAGPRRTRPSPRRVRAPSPCRGSSSCPRASPRAAPARRSRASDRLVVRGLERPDARGVATRGAAGRRPSRARAPDRGGRAPGRDPGRRRTRARRRPASGLAAARSEPTATIRARADEHVAVDDPVRAVARDDRPAADQRFHETGCLSRPRPQVLSSRPR